MSLTGVATHKNQLGTLCMLAAIFLVWSWTSKPKSGTSLQQFLRSASQLLCGGMVVWLLIQAASATATVTAAFGVTVLVLLNLRRGSGMRLLTPVVASSLVLLAVLYLSGAMEVLILAMGEDLTLTGRTDLWAEVLAAGTNPAIGAGFESFWMGGVAATLWDKYWWHPVQAHNGFIETYLNLGAVGLVLLCGYVFNLYTTSVERMRSKEFDLGRFTFTFLAVALLYNLTEAGFHGMSVVWVMQIFCGLTYVANPLRATVSEVRRSPQPYPQATISANFGGLKRGVMSSAASRIWIAARQRTSSGSARSRTVRGTPPVLIARNSADAPREQKPNPSQLRARDHRARRVFKSEKS
jgi:O-antigen ligase